MTAPIATDKDRSAVAHIIARLRPDWDAHGIAACLAKHPDQNLDVLAIQAIIAAVTRHDQTRPAVVGLDGDHANRARVALSQPTKTSQPPRDRGPECGECGVNRDDHAGPRVGTPHDWRPAEPFQPSTPEGRARARALRTTEGDQA